MSALIVPLQILDARISGYQRQLAMDNCTLNDRLVLTSMLQADMDRRYRQLENVEEEDEPTS